MPLPYFGNTGTQQWGAMPQQQPNQTSFQPNTYTNPQMGGFNSPAVSTGGFTSPYSGSPGGGNPTPTQYQSSTTPGWWNMASPQAQWQGGFAPGDAGWVGTPVSPSGGLGEEFSYNPYTGQMEWHHKTSGLQIGGSKPGDMRGAITWTDPRSGLTAIDPKMLNSLFSGLGIGGTGGINATYDPYQMTGFSPGQITPPDPYGGGDWSRPEELSAREVIESYRPTMEAEIGEGFAEAGNRLGQSGFGMSTSYAKALGDVERLARAQMNQRALEYGYDATKFDRSQELARQMAENQEKFGGWSKWGDWSMGAQGQNIANEMQKWMLENQLGFQGHHAGQMFNLESQMMDKQLQAQMQSQMLAGLLGGLF